MCHTLSLLLWEGQTRRRHHHCLAKLFTHCVADQPANHVPNDDSSHALVASAEKRKVGSAHNFQCLACPSCQTRTFQCVATLQLVVWPTPLPHCLLATNKSLHLPRKKSSNRWASVHPSLICSWPWFASSIQINAARTARLAPHGNNRIWLRWWDRFFLAAHNRPFRATLRVITASFVFNAFDSRNDTCPRLIEGSHSVGSKSISNCRGRC